MSKTLKGRQRLQEGLEGGPGHQEGLEGGHGHQEGLEGGHGCQEGLEFTFKTLGMLIPKSFLFCSDVAQFLIDFWIAASGGLHGGWGLSMGGMERPLETSGMIILSI